jgi:hypothetical protein
MLEGTGSSVFEEGNFTVQGESPRQACRGLYSFRQLDRRLRQRHRVAAVASRHNARMVRIAEKGFFFAVLDSPVSVLRY